MSDKTKQDLINAAYDGGLDDGSFEVGHLFREYAHANEDNESFGQLNEWLNHNTLGGIWIYPDSDDCNFVYSVHVAPPKNLHAMFEDWLALYGIKMKIKTEKDLISLGVKAQWDNNAVDVSSAFFAYVDAVKDKEGFEHLYDWVMESAIGEIGINLDDYSFYVVGPEDAPHTTYFRKFITDWLAGYGIMKYRENSMKNSKAEYAPRVPNKARDNEYVKHGQRNHDEDFEF